MLLKSSLEIAVWVRFEPNNIIHLFLLEYSIYFNQVALHSVIPHAYLPYLPLSSHYLFLSFSPPRNKTHKVWELSTTDNSPKKGLGNNSKQELQTRKCFWTMAASQEWYCHKATNVSVQQPTNQLGCWSWGGDIVLKIHRETREAEGCGDPLVSRPSVPGPGMANIRSQHKDAGRGTPT